MAPILLMSDISYMLGIIGMAEYLERREVAEWISNADGKLEDPRQPYAEATKDTAEENNNHESFQQHIDTLGARPNANEEEPRWPKFLLLNRWHFTLGDVDCVPSVPHGHKDSKTQGWPKLNPYTGKVFSAKNVEDIHSRLDKSDLKKIWSNDKFLVECRKQIIWYSEKFPAYNFPNAPRNKLKFPRW